MKVVSMVGCLDTGIPRVEQTPPLELFQYRKDCKHISPTIHLPFEGKLYTNLMFQLFALCQLCFKLEFHFNLWQKGQHTYQYDQQSLSKSAKIWQHLLKLVVLGLCQMPLCENTKTMFWIAEYHTNQVSNTESQKNTSFLFYKFSGIPSGHKSIKTLSRQWRYHFYSHMCDIIQLAIFLHVVKHLWLLLIQINNWL